MVLLILNKLMKNGNKDYGSAVPPSSPGLLWAAHTSTAAGHSAGAHQALGAPATGRAAAAGKNSQDVNCAKIAVVQCSPSCGLSILLRHA